MSFDKLPDELILMITSPQYLSNIELKRLRRTCRRFANILCSPLFRTLRLEITPTGYNCQNAKPFTRDDRWQHADNFAVIRDHARILEVRATNFNPSDEFQWRVDDMKICRERCVFQKTDTEFDRLLEYLPNVIEVRLKVSTTVLSQSKSKFMTDWLKSGNVKVYVTILCGGLDAMFDMMIRVPNLPMVGPNVRGLSIEKIADRVSVLPTTAVVHALRHCPNLEQLSLGFEIREFENEDGGYTSISKYLPIFASLVRMPPCTSRLTRLSIRGMIDRGRHVWPFADENPMISKFWEVVIPTMSEHLQALIVVPAEYNGFCFTGNSASYNAIKMCKRLEHLCVVPVHERGDVYLTELLELLVYSHKYLSKLQIGCCCPEYERRTKLFRSERKKLRQQLRSFVKTEQGMMGCGGVFEVVEPEAVRILDTWGYCGGDTLVTWRWTNVEKRGRLRLKGETVWCFKREEDEVMDKTGLEGLLDGMSKDWDEKSLGLVQRATRRVAPGMLEGSVRSSKSWRLQYSYRQRKVVFEER